MFLGQGTSKTIRRGNQRAQNRRREAALHIARGWCPVDTHVRNKALEIIESPTSERQEIVTAIFEDPGLLTYVLRNLGTILPEVDRIDPLKVLFEIEASQLAELLNTPERRFSKHSLAKASSKQLDEVRHTVMAIQAAKDLASQTEQDELKLSWKTYLAELSYLLVAWNYPLQYSLALGRQRKKKGDFKQELESLLGIKFEDLILSYLKDWRIQVADGITEQDNSDQEISSNLVELAGAWARSQNSKNFPEAQLKINAVKAKLVNILPQEWETKLIEGASIVEKRFERFEKNQDPKPSNQDIKDIILEESFSTPLFRKLKITEQVCFQPVLRLLEQGQYKTALMHLTKETIKELGFSNGCLFISDGQDGPLLPALRMGELPLSRYNSYDFDEREGLRPFIFNTIPFKNSRFGVSGQLVDYFISGLENGDLPGVLYLEGPHQSSHTIDSNSQSLCFRVVRAFLTHLLEKLLLDAAAKPAPQPQELPEDRIKW